MSIDPKIPIDPISGIDNYTLPHQHGLNNAGFGAEPPQRSGENVEHTPIFPADGVKVEEEYSSETKPETSLKYIEPDMPYGGSVKSSIWHTRRGGAYIELSGKRDEPEFINIVHTSGTHITLDPNGSVIIKSFGDTHNITKGNLYELSAGAKTQVHNGGYTIHVKDGTLDIRSEGNVNISSGADMSISAAGKLTMNIGDAIDIAGSKIAMTSRVDTFDIVANSKMRLTSVSNMSLKSEVDLSVESIGSTHIKAEDLYMTASGVLSGEADHAIIGGGSLVSINAPTVAIDDIVQMANGMAGSPISATAAEPAIKAGVPPELGKSIFTENTVIASAPSVGSSSIYDNIGE